MNITQSIKCNKCGMDNPPNFQFCGKCGMPLSIQNQSSSPLSSPHQPLPLTKASNIPAQFQQRLNSLLEKGDQLLAWYNRNELRFELGKYGEKTWAGTPWETNWFGDGMAITRDKIILFGGGCLSGIE